MRRIPARAPKTTPPGRVKHYAERTYKKSKFFSRSRATVPTNEDGDPMGLAGPSPQPRIRTDRAGQRRGPQEHRRPGRGAPGRLPAETRDADRRGPEDRRHARPYPHGRCRRHGPRRPAPPGCTRQPGPPTVHFRDLDGEARVRVVESSGGFDAVNVSVVGVAETSAAESSTVTVADDDGCVVSTTA